MAAYDSYLEHAVFYGVTGKTLGSLIGGAFHDCPIFRDQMTLNILNEMQMGRSWNLSDRTGILTSCIKDISMCFICGLPKCNTLKS